MLDQNDEVVEYSYEPTPAGGVRAEAHYLNKNHEYVAKELADIIIIKEFDMYNVMIMETVMKRDEKANGEIEENPRKIR